MVRSLVSMLLLLTQFQPLVGVTLCQGLATAEPSLMEDGCPMPHGGLDRVRQPPAHEFPNGSILTSAGSPYDCVFAEACLNAASVVIPTKPAFGSGPPPHDQVFRAVCALHGSDELPPPIPPPNF
jgi:hypothetical protein